LCPRAGIVTDMSGTDFHRISEYSTPGQYTVKLMLQVPGPLYPRRKYKKYRLLTVEGAITLPFVPYPGLYVTFSHWKKKKKDPVKLYLRMRTVARHDTGRVVDGV